MSEPEQEGRKSSRILPVIPKLIVSIQFAEEYPLPD